MMFFFALLLCVSWRHVARTAADYSGGQESISDSSWITLASFLHCSYQWTWYVCRLVAKGVLHSLISLLLTRHISLVFVRVFICDGLSSALLLSGCSVSWACCFVKRWLVYTRRNTSQLLPVLWLGVLWIRWQKCSRCTWYAGYESAKWKGWGFVGKLQSRWETDRGNGNERNYHSGVLQGLLFKLILIISVTTVTQTELCERGCEWQQFGTFCHCRGLK